MSYQHVMHVTHTDYELFPSKSEVFSCMILFCLCICAVCIAIYVPAFPVGQVAASDGAGCCMLWVRLVHVIG